jgi:phenylalanyl-tRNA synthetase beta chain
MKNAGYEVVESDEPTYFPGRQAYVMRDNKKIGVFGVVHPDVLQKFDIVNPCSILELDLEPLLEVEGFSLASTSLLEQAAHI